MCIFDKNNGPCNISLELKEMIKHKTIWCKFHANQTMNKQGIDDKKYEIPN